MTNEAVQADFEVHTFIEQFDKAKSMEAMALFGEAYPYEVRVVEIGGPFLVGVCGGTHVHNSGRYRSGHTAGRIVDGSGSAGWRPTSAGLVRHLAEERALMAGLTSSLKVPSEEVPAGVADLVRRSRPRRRNSTAPGSDDAGGCGR